MDGKAFILCVKLLNFYGRAICHIFLSVGREYSLLVEINDDMRRGKEWERGQRRRGKLLKWLKRNLEWNRERSPIREKFSSKNDQRNKFRSNLKPSLDILLSSSHSSRTSFKDLFWLIQRKISNLWEHWKIVKSSWETFRSYIQYLVSFSMKKECFSWMKLHEVLPSEDIK